MKSSTTAFCDHLTEPDITAWKTRAPPYPVDPGHILFYKGHNPYGIFIVYSGTIELHYNQRSTISIHTVCGPSILGLTEAVQDTPYLATAQARSPTILSFFDKFLLSQWIAQKDRLILKHLKADSAFVQQA